VEQVRTKRGRVVWALSFFVYGALVNFLLLKWIVHRMYSGDSDTTFVNHPLTNGGVTVLGGLCVSFVMMRLLTKTLGRRTIAPLSVVAKAGFWGMTATFSALELFYIFASLYLALFLANDLQPSLLQRFGMFALWFLNIQGYGIYPIALSLPFSFVYGSLAGLVILLTWRRRRVREPQIAA
jgi:hypothetical protein